MIDFLGMKLTDEGFPDGGRESIHGQENSGYQGPHVLGSLGKSILKTSDHGEDLAYCDENVAEKHRLKLDYLNIDNALPDLPDWIQTFKGAGLMFPSASWHSPAR
jgi:hypothetical protein